MQRAGRCLETVCLIAAIHGCAASPPPLSGQAPPPYVPEDATPVLVGPPLTQQATALASLPRFTESVVILRGIERLAPAWGLPTAAGDELFPELGINPLAPAGWRDAGLDPSLPFGAAEIDRETGTWCAFAHIADRAVLGRWLVSLEPVVGALDSVTIDDAREQWRSAQTNELALARRGDDLFVALGPLANDAVERITRDPQGASLGADLNFAQGARALSATDPDAVVYVDIASRLEGFSGGEPGLRNPLIDDVGSLIVGVSVDASRIALDGILMSDLETLPARALAGGNEPLPASLRTWAARAPVAAIARTDTAARDELYRSVLLLDDRPETAEAALAAAVGLDPSRELLPALGPELGLFLWATPAVPEGAGAPIRDPAWGVALAFTNEDVAQRLSATKDERLVIETSGPARLLRYGEPSPLDEARAARRQRLWDAAPEAALLAAFDLEVLSYLDAPFHYHHVELAPPSSAPPNADAEMLELVGRIRKAEEAALAAWREAERRDMTFVLEAMRQVGDVVLTATPWQKRGLRVRGELQTASGRPLELASSLLDLRKKQATALADTLSRIEELEQQRWDLNQRLKALENTD